MTAGTIRGLDKQRSLQDWAMQVYVPFKQGQGMTFTPSILG